MTAWQVNPQSERNRLSTQEQAEQTFRRLYLQANPHLAVTVATNSELYPTMSAPVNLGASMAGITDPTTMDELAASDAQDGLFGFVANLFDEAVWDPIKGTTRWLGMAAEGVYDELLVRPGRVAANMKQGMGLGEAYQESGDAPFGAFGEAIGAIGRGERANLGEGIFAESELAPEVEEQLGRVDQIAAGIGTPSVDQSLQQWGLRAVGTGWNDLSVNQRQMIYSAKEREHIISRAEGQKGGLYTDMTTGQEYDLGGAQANSGYGSPLTQSWKTEAEATFMFTDKLPWNQGENGTGVFSQVSPGRVAATMFVEPGTKPYHFASGIIDAGVQIGADPADKVLLGLKAARAGGRALGLGDEAVTALRTAQDNRAILAESQKALDEINASGDLEKLAGFAESTQRRAATYATTAEDLAGPQKQRLQALARRRAEADRLQAQIDDLNSQQNIADVFKAQAGLIGDTPRVDVMPGDMNRWITGKTATPFVENFTRATTMDEVDQLLKHVRVPVTRQLRAGLKEAQTNSEVVALLLPEIGGAVTESGLSLIGRHISPLVTAGVDDMNKMQGARYRAKMAFNGSRIKRWFNEVAPGTMDLNDLDRSYGKLKLLSENLGLKYTDELDRIFEDFARIEDNDFAEGYEVMRRFMDHAFEQLTEAGVQKGVATEITKFTAQFRKTVNSSVLDDLRGDADWFINRVGDVVREPNAATKVLVDGREIASPGPQLITELFNGQVALADHNLIRRAVASTDRLGRITNKLVTRGADNFFQERWGLRVANTVLSQVWKPLVLLRVAWPVRVVGEEQARMSAAGLGSMFSIAPGSGHHPLSYFAMMMGRKGMVDVKGGEIAAAEEFMQAMARRANFDGEMGAAGSRYWTKIRRGDADYADALVGELNMLWSDPVVQRMFTEELVGLDLNDVGRMDEVADWLMMGEGRQWLNQLTRNAPAETKNVMATREGVRTYLEGVYARAHMKAGGTYRHIKADGTWIDDVGLTGKLTPDEMRQWGQREGYEIITPGNDEILDAYSTGNLGGLNVRAKLSSDRNSLGTKGFVDYDQVKRQVQRVERESGEAFPEVLKGVKYTDSNVGDIKEGYDKAVERMFDWFMTRPTNRLSRSPAFRDTYWQRIGELRPYMDDDTWAKVAKQADEAGMSQIMQGGPLSTRKYEVGKVRKMGGSIDAEDVGTMGLDEADMLAKAYALETTKELLYDLSRRHNITEAMSIIAPFAEAFGEVTTRWAKIMNEQMLRPGRRFQQVLESGRESNPFDTESGYSNQGMLYDNQYGDEVFAAPWPLPFMQGGKFEYQVGSLNFVNSIIPGMGPAIQLPANLFLPDDPGWDPIREAISPFGGEGNIVAEWMPSYLKRILSSIEVGRTILGDAESVRMFEATVADVMRNKALKDPAGFAQAQQDPEMNAKWLQDARNEARNLYIIRGAATFMGPTSPTFQFQVEDKDGKVWATNAFAEEYRRLLDINQGDAMAASEQFIAAFGVNPAPLAASKSTTIDKRSSTKVGNAWQRQNQELFDQYPSTAYYFGPALAEEGGEFDYTAYLRQFQEGTRKPLTQQEYQATMNDFLARVDLDNYTKGVEAVYGHTLDESADEWGNSEKKLRAQQEVTNYRNSLVSKYPGYDPTSFKPAGVGARTSVTEMIGELKNIVADPPEKLQGNEVVTAAGQYLQMREAAIAVAQAEGFMSFAQAGEFETLADDPEHPAFRIRMWLRKQGEELIEQYPTFWPLYDEVFNREMAQDAAVTQQQDIDFIGGE